MNMYSLIDFNQQVLKKKKKTSVDWAQLYAYNCL